MIIFDIDSKIEVTRKHLYDEEISNKYVNLTYLQELKETFNYKIAGHQNKSEKFYQNFRSIFIILILYIVTTIFVIFFEKRK